MFTNPHEHVHVPHTNTPTIKNQQKGKQLEPARSHRCSQQNWKWMPDGPDSKAHYPGSAQGVLASQGLDISQVCLVLSFKYL